MNRITDKIWIGDSHDAKDLESLKKEDIRYLLNCAEDLPVQLGWKDGIWSFHCGMTDGPNHRSLYEAAIHILTALNEGDKRILVHCHEGRSRSVFVVASFLHKQDPSADIKTWVNYIKSKGRDVNVMEGHFKSYNPTQP